MENVFIVYLLDVYGPDAIVECFDSRMGAEQYIDDRTDLEIYACTLSSMRLGIVEPPDPED